MLILLFSGYNVWDTLFFSRILRIIRFFVIFLDEISLFFGDLDISLVWFSIFFKVFSFLIFKLCVILFCRVVGCSIVIEFFILF